MSYYPIVLKLEGRPCLVVGGGVVAERKAVSLLEAGARVRVVAPRFTPRLEALGREGVVELVPREYQGQDLQGVALVISAASRREVNAQVAQEAGERGLLVNVVDSPQECSFIVPSVVRRGGLILAISTSGLSPALARHLREKLEEEFGEEFLRRYDEALELAAQMEMISTSYLQRRFRIGYNTAARIIEKMEKDGVVGPAQGSRPREVLKRQ